MRYVTAVVGAFIVFVGILLVGMLGIGSLYKPLVPVFGDAMWEIVAGILSLAVLTLAIYGAWRSYRATVWQFETDPDKPRRGPPRSAPPSET
jgi:ABC-type anion transport system duplicated permease subunit